VGGGWTGRGWEERGRIWVLTCAEKCQILNLPLNFNLGTNLQRLELKSELSTLCTWSTTAYGIMQSLEHGWSRECLRAGGCLRPICHVQIRDNYAKSHHCSYLIIAYCPSRPTPCQILTIFPAYLHCHLHCERAANMQLLLLLLLPYGLPLMQLWVHGKAQQLQLPYHQLLMHYYIDLAHGPCQ
jgi:hypothetical protein